MKTTVSFDLMKGMTCTGVSSRDGGPALLRNMKVMQSGGYTQTWPWRSVCTIPYGNYYNGTTTVNESAISSEFTKLTNLCYVDGYWVALSGYCAREIYSLESINPTVGPDPIPVLRQTTVPTGDTLWTNLLFVPAGINGVSHITLGSQLRVVIASATTFQWEINGAGLSGAVTIDTTTFSNTITSGSFSGTLYFLTSTGFTIGHEWRWTRTDALHELSGYSTSGPRSAVIANQKLYFTDSAGRVMVYEDFCIRSVGYRPIYGTHLAVFANHLYVTWARETKSGNTAAARVIQNSDLNNFDNFFSTDTNEADSYTLPVAATGSDYVIGFISGLSVISDRLYVYTPQISYYTLNLGLPLVNNYTEGVRNGPAFFDGVQTFVSSPRGDYLYDGLNFFLFDGVAIQPISNSIKGLRSRIYGGWYDKMNDEVVFSVSHVTDFRGVSLTGVSNQVLLCYQAASGTWYIRSADFDGVTGYGLGGLLSSPTFPLAPLFVARDRSIFCETSEIPVNFAYDSTGGTAYTAPLAVFNQAVFNDVGKTVEIETMSVDIDYDKTAATVAAQPVKIYWGADEVSKVGTNTTLPTAYSFYDGILGRTNMVPCRLAGRAFTFAVEFPVTASKPSRFATISAIEPYVYGAKDPHAAEK